MNLYELAHHPDAWDAAQMSVNPGDPLARLAWWNSINVTGEQFEMLNNTTFEQNATILADVFNGDENEFRMHLLFVHWATLPPEETK